jgi:protein-disulfide isomerase
MKYVQFAIGLLAGTALGGAVVASTGTPLSGTAGGLDKDAVQQIVRDTIKQEPKLIIDSLQKYTEDQRKAQNASAGAVLKDPAVHAQVYDTDAAFVGPKDAKHVVVEFFDYNCPACKFMFKGIDELITKHKDVKVVFREYPIFGPQSDEDSKIGIAVWRLYPEKYFAFHTKMIEHEGHGTDDKIVYGYIKDLGMDEQKIKTEAAKKDVMDVIDANRALGEKLHIQGTPTLVVGDQIVPHAMDSGELESMATGAPAAAPSDAGAAAN